MNKTLKVNLLIIALSACVLSANAEKPKAKKVLVPPTEKPVTGNKQVTNSTISTLKVGHKTYYVQPTK